MVLLIAKNFQFVKLSQEDLGTKKPRRPNSAKTEGGTLTTKLVKLNQCHPLSMCRPVETLAMSMAYPKEKKKLATLAGETKNRTSRSQCRF